MYNIIVLPRGNALKDSSPGSNNTATFINSPELVVKKIYFFNSGYRIYGPIDRRRYRACRSNSVVRDYAFKIVHLPDQLPDPFKSADILAIPLFALFGRQRSAGIKSRT